MSWRLEKDAGVSTYSSDIADAHVELDASDPPFDAGDFFEMDDRFRYLVEFMQRERITRIEVKRR